MAERRARELRQRELFAIRMAALTGSATTDTKRRTVWSYYTKNGGWSITATGRQTPTTVQYYKKNMLSSVNQKDDKGSKGNSSR